MPSLTKIAVLGGSGMTGLCVIEEALSAGLIVRALLRPTSILPSGLETELEIIRGDATDLNAVKETISGTDGVVIALGTRNNVEPTTMMSTAVENALLAMQEIGQRPITVCLSSFLFLPQNAVPPIFKHINEEHGRMLSALEQSQSEWVAVMPPHIADQPKSGFHVKENALPGGRVVSKFDLGTFLVEALSKPECYRKRMGISSIVAS